jgi:hypothetical protein
MTDLLAQVKLVANTTDMEGGILPASAVPEAEWYLAEADLWLHRERGK